MRTIFIEAMTERIDILIRMKDKNCMQSQTDKQYAKITHNAL